MAPHLAGQGHQVPLQCGQDVPLLLHQQARRDACGAGRKGAQERRLVSRWMVGAIPIGSLMAAP